MDSPSWTFPNNAYSDENGLDTSDMETFKRDPMSSLAREICQNSIDASTGADTVRVEFSLFEVQREEIPGIDDLTYQIERCYSYKKDSPKEGRALKSLRENILKPEITCLRISDFNTTGVYGVSTNEHGKPFYNLTRGSGVSDKSYASGGSKGIGKFASFVVSATNTVFYSTQTSEGESGYLGISRLRSVPINDNDPELMTLGMGYFGIGEKNLPVQHELHLDKTFERKPGETGTDVFIIGFNKGSAWKDEILTKVLESFMVAVMRRKLEVAIDGTLVNSETVGEILSDKQFGSHSTPTTVKAIRAQFDLLSGSNEVHVDEVEVIDGISVTVYMREYSQAEAASATKRCVMVRYPYMKITHITTGAVLPFSALCIIEKNKLNDDLRLIENPQHTDWEIKRLEDFPDDRKRVKKELAALKKNVKNYILESLRNSTGDSTDIVGAGEFLPSQDDYGETTGKGGQSEGGKVSPIIVTKVKVPKTVKSGNAGENLEFSTGEQSNDGEDGRIPHKSDEEPNPNPYPDPEPNPDDAVPVKEGSEPILKKATLSGMRYTNIVRSKREGLYTCVFKSLYDENNCELQIRLCGESNDKYPVEIIDASINGKPCTVKNGSIVGLSLSKGSKYTISYRVNKHTLFASEVIVNAYR